MATEQLESGVPGNHIDSALRNINSRRPERVARLIDAQFNTSDRISSAYSRIREADKSKRALSGFEIALARDAERCLRGLDLKQLRLPFWWKYGVVVVIAAVAVAGGIGFAGYRWYSHYERQPALASATSHLPGQVQRLRGLATQLGAAATAAGGANFKVLGEDLINGSDYLDLLARDLGSQDLVHIGATIKTAGADLKAGKMKDSGAMLSEAGKDLSALDAGGMSLAEAGAAFAEAGRLLTATGETADPAALKNLGIGLANDLMEAREVIMNAASKLEFYEEEKTLQNLESSLETGDKDKLLDNMSELGDVLKDLNSHLVSQSLPLMERNIPWQDLANLEKMTSGWDDTWPSYVPSAKIPKDLGKAPDAGDPSLSPEDARTLYKALTEASQAIAKASQHMELMRVKGNPEDLANIAQDLKSAEMALKETSKLARAVAANYISSIKLNVPTSFEDVTMPTATNFGQAWIYQQQEPNMGVSDLWKMRYVSSYYGSLGIAGDQLGSAGEMLGSAYGLWNNASDIKAMQEMKMGEAQLIGASRRIAMTLDNYAELRDLQQQTTAVQSYSNAIKKMGEQQAALEKATNPQSALNALSAEMQALAEPFATTPMYKPDAYYFLDEAGRKIGLAATQKGDQQRATLESAAGDISKTSAVLFGTQEINLREYGQFLDDIASNLTSTTANTGGQYFLGPIRKVALDFRGLQELLGVQVKWEGQTGQYLASELDRTLVAGTVLLRPVTGDEKSASPNLMASYYIEAPNTSRWPQVKYSGELLAVPALDPSVMERDPGKDNGSLSPERPPSDGADIMRRYFLALAQDGVGVKNWVKKEVPVKPGQPHVTVPPLPPDMPPRQPPSSGGGLICPAVGGTK